MGGVRGPARRLERHGAEGTTRGSSGSFGGGQGPAAWRHAATFGHSIDASFAAKVTPPGEARQSLDFDLDFGSRHTDAVAGDIVIRWRTKDLSRPDVELRTVQRADDLVASDLSLGQRPGVMCARAKNSPLLLNRAICVPFTSISRAWRARSRPSSPLSQSQPWILPLVCFGTTLDAMNIVNATSAPCLSGVAGGRLRRKALRGLSCEPPSSDLLLCPVSAGAW